MSGAAQLRLITTPASATPAPSTDPTRQVFEHWLYMLAKSPARCKLGPTRRAAINAALTLYDVETLHLAIEGMAGDPLDGCSDKMAAAMRELEWLLAKEARVERWADMGEHFRLRVQRDEHQAAAEPDIAPAPVDPVVAAAARDRLRQFCAARREPQHG